MIASLTFYYENKFLLVFLYSSVKGLIRLDLCWCVSNDRE